MGNKNSATSKALRAKVASFEEPQAQYVVVSMQRKHSTNPEVVSVRAYPTEEQGEKPLCDDHTFSDYIQRTKYKIRSNSNIGCNEDQRDPAHADHVAPATNKNQNEDPFSDYIQNARKKLRMRTLSRNVYSFKRG
ncbi:hypothetical protein DEO72_LG9g207 [Vigna unguiculata]|uniref:Uncharacterized protein n=1 Tax=Vigna unguiculata TaxID=3917 RepID=A0A4D6MZC2_VIGUN|nr:hypothetical protein DEO72_LG9g207 [Vigna unguiculata]